MASPAAMLFLLRLLRERSKSKKATFLDTVEIFLSRPSRETAGLLLEQGLLEVAAAVTAFLVVAGFVLLFYFYVVPWLFLR